MRIRGNTRDIVIVFAAIYKCDRIVIDNGRKIDLYHNEEKDIQTIPNFYDTFKVEALPSGLYLTAIDEKEYYTKSTIEVLL